ncbi:hypothetical protein ACHAW5_003393 [Stephanodiscus triporus]|uniref:Peptidase S1 domain-containing protein n=1 Tax=Stephanodiscus triporus TaxID=2934178 RepID=A0ABD3NPV3_9STRA
MTTTTMRRRRRCLHRDHPSSAFAVPSAAASVADEGGSRKTKRGPIALFVTAMLAVAVVTASVALSTRNKNEGGSGAQHSDAIPPSNMAVDAVAARIIGGSEAVEDRYSYAVSLQDYNGGHYCGGSLIARDVVLTAAHCQGIAYKVVLGRHDLDDYNGEALFVKQEMPHPEYNEALTDNDFMLMFLDGASTAENVVTVRLNSESVVPAAGQDVTVMGWGDTNASELYQDISDVLMNVELKVVSNLECSAASGWDAWSYETYDGKITDNMMCASDSGGPLVMNDGDAGYDMQIGVVSWGFGCASDQFPGVYARVSQAYEWIQSEVCKGSNYASGAGFDCSDGGSSAPPTYLPTNPPVTESTNPPVSAPIDGQTTVDDPCNLCPNGVTYGDFAPYEDAGFPWTCDEYIGSALLYETGSDACAEFESWELEQFCCPNTATEDNVVDDLWDFVSGLFGGNRA